MQTQSKTRSAKLAGFSLVEVALALGIIGFAMTSILGLLSLGVSTFRDAVESTMQAKIVSGLTNRATQMDFSNLNQLAGPLNPPAGADVKSAKLYYFSDEGVELAAADVAKSIYTAAIYYTAPTTLPSGTPDPSGQASAYQSSNLATVRIDIYENHGASVINTSSPVKATFLVRVANFGQRL